jgi:hypothetical protein
MFHYPFCNAHRQVACEDRVVSLISGVPRNFYRGGGLRQEFFRGGGVQQIQWRIEGRENGDLGAVAPLVRGSTQFANE